MKDALLVILAITQAGLAYVFYIQAKRLAHYAKSLKDQKESDEKAFQAFTKLNNDVVRLQSKQTKTDLMIVKYGMK